MKKYTVIAGACPYPPQKQILNFGDVRDESFFTEGDAGNLVQRGFLKEVEEVAVAETDPNAGDGGAADPDTTTDHNDPEAGKAKAAAKKK